MNTHIVFTHPNPKSFNAILKDTALNTLQELGGQVTVSDLHALNFKASADASDFLRLQQPEYFDLQIEQLAALRDHSFTADIVREQSLLQAADLVIFQFPLWWYSMPALMKGYIDRVFSAGWAYAGGQALAGKIALLSVTTGAPEMMWNEEQKGDLHNILRHLTQGTFAMCGMRSLDPFVVFGAKRMNSEQRGAVVKAYMERLLQIAK